MTLDERPICGDSAHRHPGPCELYVKPADRPHLVRRTTVKNALWLTPAESSALRSILNRAIGLDDLQHEVRSDLAERLRYFP